MKRQRNYDPTAHDWVDTVVMLLLIAFLLGVAAPWLHSAVSAGTVRL